MGTLPKDKDTVYCLGGIQISKSIYHYTALIPKTVAIKYSVNAWSSPNDCWLTSSLWNIIRSPSNMSWVNGSAEPSVEL